MLSVAQEMTLLGQIGIPVATAILGAIGGGAYTYWLQRSRIVVHLDALSISTEFPSEQRPVAFEADLIERLDNYERSLMSDSTLSDYLSGESATESQYVATLREAQRSLTRQIEGVLPRLKVSVDDMRQMVLTSDYRSLEKLLARDAREFWETFCVSLMRGEFIFPEPAPPAPPTAGPPSGLVAVEATYRDPDENGEYPYYVIPIPGPKNIVLAFYGAGTAHRQQLSEAARRFANAVTTRNRTELLAVIDHVRERIEVERRSGIELHNDVENELTPYARMIVRGVLSNAGRTPISITSRARLTVEMRGYRGSVGVAEDDIDMPLTVATAASEEEEGDRTPGSAPIFVDSGQSIRFIGVSDVTIDAITNAADLRATFAGGSQQCYLTLGALSGGDNEFSPKHSPPVLFRDLLQSAGLPRPRRRPFK